MTGEDFRTIRKAMRLRQQELATLMGVTQATISRWETNDLSIDTRTATTLRALHVMKSAA
jgi:transcriptional regulator with XRE-family HTH domain